MRNITDKIDNVSTLSAAEFNGSIMQELENAVTNTGITLDPAGGADTDNEMLAQAVSRTAQGAMSYTDGGAADAYVLTAKGGFVQPSAYTDGMIVTFQAGNANTGASTINVSGIGVTDLKDNTGTALASGAVEADIFYIAQYNLANTEFRIVSGSSSDLDLAVKADVEAETAGKVIDADVLKYGNGVFKSFIAVDQTGTQSIRSSHNITSIVDSGVGITDVAMSITMSNSGYTTLCGGTGQDFNVSVSALTTTSYRLSSWNSEGNFYQDIGHVCVGVLGELA